MNKDLRELALLVLDDDNGINEAAYAQLSGMLKDNNCRDILDQVDATDGRFYIGENWAEEALRDLSKWEEAQEDPE